MSMVARTLAVTAPQAEQLDWLDQHHHAVDALLMHQGFLPLYPQLVDACGSLKGAVMLGQAIALSRNWLRENQSRNGWFWLTATDWQAATGLTPREQESARQDLVDAGLWQERRTHNPSRLYHRVQLPAVAAAMGLRQRPPSAAGDEAWNWNDAVAERLLGQAPALYFKALADLAGGVMPGLLLSLLLGEQRRALRQNRVGPDGRYEVKYERLAGELGMGAKATRNARDHLRRAGFIQDATCGSGPLATVRVGVNLPAMLACLQARPVADQRARVPAPTYRAPAECHPVRPAPELAIADLRQSGTATATQQLDLLGLASASDQGLASVSTDQVEVRAEGVVALLSIADEPVDKVAALLSIAEESRCPFVDRVDALLSIAYTDIELNTTTPPKVPSSTSVDNSAPGRRRVENEPKGQSQEAVAFSAGDLGALVVPAGVDAAAALRVVGSLPTDVRQLVLDELAGNMASKRKTIDSPVGYLHMLSRKAQQGTFVATVALDVAVHRQAKAAAQRREAEALKTPVQAAIAQGQDAAPVQPSPEVRARLQAARASLGGRRSVADQEVSE